jgi:hypothetical protein
VYDNIEGMPVRRRIAGQHVHQFAVIAHRRIVPESVY